MNKTKTFTQYIGDSFNIGIVIKNNGNIQSRSIFSFYNKNRKNYYNEWMKNNQNHLKKYKSEWYNNNKNKILINRKKYRKENKEIIKERKKRDYINNKEKYNKYSREWKENNPEKTRLYDIKAHASRKNWGCDPINKYFKGSHFHHLHINGDKDIGVYIPAKIHKSIWHSNKDKESMNKINNLAFEWLENNRDC